MSLFNTVFVLIALFSEAWRCRKFIQLDFGFFNTFCDEEYIFLAENTNYHCRGLYFNFNFNFLSWLCFLLFWQLIKHDIRTTPSICIEMNQLTCAVPGGGDQSLHLGPYSNIYGLMLHYEPSIAQIFILLEIKLCFRFDVGNLH